LKANLTTPDLITAYVETYNEERKRLAAGLIANRSRIEKRLARAKREFDRILKITGPIHSRRQAPAP